MPTSQRIRCVDGNLRRLSPAYLNADFEYDDGGEHGSRPSGPLLALETRSGSTASLQPSSAQDRPARRQAPLAIESNDPAAGIVFHADAQ